AAAGLARDRPLAASRRARGAVAPRPSRPRLRSCDRRDLAGAVRAVGASAARRARAPSLAPPARGAALALPAPRRSRGDVDRGRALASCARGGEEIQAPRPGRARLATGAGALLVTVVLALSPFLRGSSHAAALAGLGAAGVAWLCVGLAFRWSSALAVGIAVLGAEQATRLALTSNGVDPWTPVYAIGFVLAAELAWWSIEPRVGAWAEPFLTLWRLGTVALVCAGGGFLAA